MNINIKELQELGISITDVIEKLHLDSYAVKERYHENMNFDLSPQQLKELIISNN